MTVPYGILIGCALVEVFSSAAAQGRYYGTYHAPFAYPSARSDVIIANPTQLFKSFVPFKDASFEEPIQLKMNRNRAAINKPGYTCGVPGNGLVDPFELGSKWESPTPDQVFQQPTDLTNATKRFLKPSRLIRIPRQTRFEDVGEVAMSNAFCWQVLIRFDLQNGTNKLCGGTIIGARTILTSAHCLIDRRQNKVFHPSVVTVQIGEDGGLDGQCSEIIPAGLLIPHPSYDMNLEDNDIGVVILSREIDFETKPCACKLCVKNIEPKASDVCLVYGTGKKVEEQMTRIGPIKWHKQQVLRQTFDSQCAFHVGGGRITQLENFICAGDLDSDKSCTGDEGTPLVCFDQPSRTYYAAGITSFSAGCGKRIGSQYTKVRTYLDWIEANSPKYDVRVQRGWNIEIARSLDDDRR